MSHYDGDETLGQQIHSFFRRSEGVAKAVRNARYESRGQYYVGLEDRMDRILSYYRARIKKEFDAMRSWNGTGKLHQKKKSR